MTEQSQRGATQNFRTARVFDGSSTDGRPHVDRQMLDEREASQVLSYLEAAPVVHTTNGLGLDRIDPMRGKAVPLTWLTDGSWVWPGSVSYYLSNYALPPDPELLTHIRRRNFRPPAVDAATRQAAVKAVAGRPPTDPPTHAPVAPATSAGSVFTPAAGAASSATSGPLARPAAGPPASGPPKAGSPRSGPPASGPSASGPSVSGPSVSGPSVSGPPGSGPPGSGPLGSGPSGSRPSGSGPSTGPNAVPPPPATKPTPPSAPPAGGDLPAGDRAPLAAAGRVPQPAPAARPGASAPGRRPSGGSGSAPTITSRPAGPRVAGTRPPTAQPPGGSPPAVQSPAAQSPAVQSPAAQSPAAQPSAAQSAAAHAGHVQPPGARGPGFPAGAYQAGSPPQNHLGAGPAPAGEPPVRGAAPGPRPAAGPPPVSAPPVSSSDDSANFDRLRSAAGALGVSKRAYRIGAGAEGAWSVLRDGSKWAVFRTELGVRHDLASFTNSQHATAYLIGQLYLTQGAGVLGPDQARRPAATAPPGASTPPVTATTRPAPVVPAANTPATTPTARTAVSSTRDTARPGDAVRPASAVADDVAVTDATANGQPAAENTEAEPPGPAVQASDQAVKPTGDKAVSGGSAIASELVDTGAAAAAAGQRADQDSGPVPRGSTTARESRTSHTDSGSAKAGSADEPGGPDQQPAASDAPGPAAASPDPTPATKAGPTPATEPAPAGPTEPASSTAQSQAPAAPPQGTSRPGPTTPAASSERSATGGSATSGPAAAERAGRPAAAPDDRLGLKAGPPAGSTAGALDVPTTGPGPSVAKPEAAGRDAGRPAPPSRPAGTAGEPARPDSPGAGSIFTPVVPAVPPAAAAGPPRTSSAAATPAGRPATPGPATPSPTTPGPAADRGPASPGWSIQPLPGEPPLTLYRDKHPVVLKPDTEIDRYGEANGNVVYAARTKYPQRSLPTEWSTFTYHAYRLARPLEVLTGVAVPWFDQPGGGTVFVLPRSIAELLADGALVEVRNAVPNQ